MVNEKSYQYKWPDCATPATVKVRLIVRCLLIGVAFSVFPLSVSALDSDSLPVDSVMTESYELREIAVERQRVVRDGNGVSRFYPSASEKRLASDGFGVLRNMAVPDLKIDPVTNSVKNAFGDEVALFVDSLPADRQQIAGLNTADIIRIDFIESPENPVFGGARTVLNFIMKKYEYGGYSKFSARQSVVSEGGLYSVYSKFSYKRLTWDLNAYYGYDKSAHTGTESESRYRFPDGELLRTSTDNEMDYLRRLPSVTLRSIYQSDKSTISNTVGFKLIDVPSSNQSGMLNVSSSGEKRFDNFENSSTKAVSWSGQYNFKLPRSMMLSLSPGLSYNRIGINTYYMVEGGSPLVNDISEDAVAASLGASLSKNVGKHSVAVQANGSYSGNDINYEGSTNAKNVLRNYFAHGDVSASLNFGKGWLVPNAGVSFLSNTQSGYTYQKVLPTVFISGGCSLSQRSSLYAVLHTALWSNGPTDRGDTRVYINDIEAVEGNKYLKTTDVYRAAVQYSLQPAGNLWLSLAAQYQMWHRPVVPIWIPEAEGSRDIMVRTYVNDGSKTETNIDLNASLRLFKNRLALSGSLSYWHYHQSGIVHCIVNTPRYNFRGAFTWGNVQVEAYVSHLVKSLQGVAVNKYRPYYHMMVSWGMGNWYLSAVAANPFSSSCRNYSYIINTPYYYSYNQDFTPDARRYFMFTVNYTIGYGKKINKAQDLQSIGTLESGILK